MSRQSCNLDFDGCDRSVACGFPCVLFSPLSVFFSYFSWLVLLLRSTIKIPLALYQREATAGWTVHRDADFASTGVPYRDKGTMMTGFKDWLTQISGAICHAPTGRRRRRRSVATPAHLRRRCFCLASPLLWDASSVPISLQDHFSRLPARLH